MSQPRRSRTPSSLVPVPQPITPALPWVQVAEGVPYFMTEDGQPWTPVGHNDSTWWPALIGAFRGKNLAAVEEYLAMLAAYGVTVLRLMLEYCQTESRYFERPVGHYQPHLVTMWDDLLALCAKYGIRVLLTPYDTFFMWIRWARHPYNQKNGGPVEDRARMLLNREARQLIKNRLTFMTERWGGSGVIFAWDLWNEIHPSYAGDSADCFDEFIEELSTHMRDTELRLHGRAHPQTVSMFGPHIILHDNIADAIYRHRALDFASTHLYETGSIDHPKNTVQAAISFGRLVKEAIEQIPDNRPYFDSEHGPIHTFKDRHRTLPEVFDDEYFRHMQWAHVASGGAGGGMRWPNRKVHLLTPGMHEAQRGLSRFLPLIDWTQFERRNVTACLHTLPASVSGFACADERQAIVYLLRTDILAKDGRLRLDAEPVEVHFQLPMLLPGSYRVTLWDTRKGEAVEQRDLHIPAEPLHVPLKTDLVLAITRQA